MGANLIAGADDDDWEDTHVRTRCAQADLLLTSEFKLILSADPASPIQLGGRLHRYEIGGLWSVHFLPIAPNWKHDALGCIWPQCTI